MKEIIVPIATIVTMGLLIFLGLGIATIIPICKLAIMRWLYYTKSCDRFGNDRWVPKKEYVTWVTWVLEGPSELRKGRQP